MVFVFVTAKLTLLIMACPDCLARAVSFRETTCPKSSLMGSHNVLSLAIQRLVVHTAARRAAASLFGVPIIRVNFAIINFKSTI